jgi:hypothetical protein
LSDGTRSFTATSASTSTSLTGWTLGNLSITPPFAFSGTFTLNVTATAQESASSSAASTSKPLTVTVIDLPNVSPLVIDLNGDGIHTTSIDLSSGTFDLLNNGNPISSGWLSPEDGFLAMDTNGNGIIDDRSELFGGAVGEGFAKLASFDTNLDGSVDAKDERFADLKLWQDANGNHRTDAGELSSLAERGVASLSTRYVMAPTEQNGNWLLEHGTATFQDGRTVSLVDAYFAIDATYVQAATTPQEDRGASITVRSALPQPVLPAGAPVFAAGAVFGRGVQASSGPAPVIDWTSLYSGGDGDGREKSRKERPVKSWLADFLGLGSSGGARDLAKTTGLKVAVGGDIKS